MDQMLKDTIAYSNAVRGLLFWQPGAEAIRRAPASCPVCSSSMYITYSLHGLNASPPIDELLEYCGTYCGACMFDGASARKRV